MGYSLIIFSPPLYSPNYRYLKADESLLLTRRPEPDVND